MGPIQCCFCCCPEYCDCNFRSPSATALVLQVLRYPTVKLHCLAVCDIDVGVVEAEQKCPEGQPNCHAGVRQQGTGSGHTAGNNQSVVSKEGNSGSDGFPLQCCAMAGASPRQTASRFTLRTGGRWAGLYDRGGLGCVIAHR